MPSRSPRTIALCGAVVTVLAGVLVTPAGAADRLDFQLTPVGGSAYPRFSARPGQSVSGALRLHSRTRRPQVIRVEVVDLMTATTGGIEFGRDRARATGSWLKLARRDVRLPPHATRIIRFRGQVPRTAAAGEHFGGIAASDRAEIRRTPATRAGVRLREVTRVALPVRFRVPGPASAAIELRGVAFASNAAGTRLDLDLRSVGHRLVRATDVDLRATDAAGRVALRHRSSISDFVPQTAIRYPAVWRGRPTRGGRYHLTGTIQPRGARPIRVDEVVTFGTREARRLEDQTGEPPPTTSGAPILLIAALGASALLAAAALGAYVRLRRRLARLRAAAHA